MKNLFLSTAFALLSVASFAQELTRSLTHPLYCEQEIDHMVVYKLSGGCLEENPGFFGDVDYSTFDYALEAVYEGNRNDHTWDESGVYVVCCFKNNLPVNERAVFVINDGYVDYAEYILHGSTEPSKRKHVISYRGVPVGREKVYVYAVD
jgi:hypothetical protein